MHLRNREGTAVDPVPWFVVTAVAFATMYSFGPMYFAALGLALPYGVALSTGAFLTTAAAGFYRLVWTFRPAHRAEVPVGRRFERLLIAALVCVAVAALLALPLAV